MLIINIIISFLIALGLSDAVYILYKKKYKQKPSALILFAILSPIFGFLLSLIWLDDNILICLKNVVLGTIIVLLIPLNIICLKRGFKRDVYSAKNIYTKSEEVLKEEKKLFKRNKNINTKNKENNDNTKEDE